MLFTDLVRGATANRLKPQFFFRLRMHAKDLEKAASAAPNDEQNDTTSLFAQMHIEKPPIQHLLVRSFKGGSDYAMYNGTGVTLLDLLQQIYGYPGCPLASDCYIIKCWLGEHHMGGLFGTTEENTKADRYENPVVWKRMRIVRGGLGRHR